MPLTNINNVNIILQNGNNCNNQMKNQPIKLIETERKIRCIKVFFVHEKEHNKR